MKGWRRGAKVGGCEVFVVNELYMELLVARYEYLKYLTVVINQDVVIPKI